MSTTSKTAVEIQQHKMLIDGEFVSSKTMLPVSNPATEEVISEVPAATPEQVHEAVLAAERAQVGWARLPAIQRARHLHEIAGAIRRKKSFLAHTIAEEQGKILPLAEIEVDFSADYVDYMAEFARRYEGNIIQSDRPGENRYSAVELSVFPDCAQDGARAGYGQRHRDQAERRYAEQRL